MTRVTLKQGVTASRDSNGNVITNVRRLVTQHSPTGFAWGYAGSGPADFALNIVEEYLRLLGYKGEKVECWKGRCFDLAYDLHQQFKFQFLGEDTEELFIPHDTIVNWIKENAGDRL